MYLKSDIKTEVERGSWSSKENMKLHIEWVCECVRVYDKRCHDEKKAPQMPAHNHSIIILICFVFFALQILCLMSHLKSTAVSFPSFLMCCDETIEHKRIHKARHIWCLFGDDPLLYCLSLVSFIFVVLLWLPIPINIHSEQRANSH